MGKKKKSKEVDEELYQVEVILAARVDPTYNWEYLVKWGGYGDDANSWEPQMNVKDCERLLKSFWTHISTKDKNWDIGDEVKPTQDWIDSERDYFRRELAEELAEEAKKAQGKRKKKSQQLGPNESGSSTSASKLKIKIPKRPQVHREEVTIDDSDGSEDVRGGSTTFTRHRKRVLLSSSEDEVDERPLKVLKTIPTPSAPLTQQVSAKKSQEGTLENNTISSPDSPSSLFSLLSSGQGTVSPAELMGKHTTAQAQPSGTKTKPPKASTPRSKAQKPEPPQTRVMAGSSLSTKQRLAQSALTLTPSTNPTITTALHEKSIPPPRASSLAGLSFKKTSSAPDDAAASGSKSAVPVSPVPLPLPPPPYASTSSSELVAADTPVDDHDYQTFETDTNTYAPSLSHEPVPLAQATEAEQFLSSIVPAGLATPLEPPPETTPPAPMPLRPIVKTTLKRIPKKWKWNGELFVDVAQDTAERICDVVLMDPTDHPDEGLRLNMLFDSMDSLRLKKLLSLPSLEIVLRACSPIQQLARLTPKESQSSEALKNLSILMIRREQVAVAEMLYSSTNVGILVVFPSSLESLCSRFKAPDYMRQAGGLIVALFAWIHLENFDYKIQQQHPIWDEQESSVDLPVVPAGRRNYSIRNDALYHHANRILQLPIWLYDFMSMPNRPYCVWWASGDGTMMEKGLETKLLFSILDHCGAKDVGHKADVRAVFVHVGALTTLHKLIALAERRSKRFEVQFVTFGTHHSVPRDRWGVREIYPLGGVVTFTPSALFEDPIGACQLITQIAEHPLWTCYLLPSIIGMLAKLTCRERDPLTVFDQGEFFDDYLLNLVAEGRVSLLRSPPQVQEESDSHKWALTQLEMLQLKRRDLLEKCMLEFTKVYSHTEEPGWMSAAEAEISQDLLSMQLQPAVMDAYRRYVVIKGIHDDHIPWDKDGLEWLSISNFNFKDDFYAKLTEEGKSPTITA